MILGEVKARPKDIISFSLDYISKSKVQTSNPSSSPTPLDTPARPADFDLCLTVCFHKYVAVYGGTAWYAEYFYVFLVVICLSASHSLLSSHLP